MANSAVHRHTDEPACPQGVPMLLPFTDKAQFSDTTALTLWACNRRSTFTGGTAGFLATWKPLESLTIHLLCSRPSFHTLGVSAATSATDVTEIRGHEDKYGSIQPVGEERDLLTPGM